MKDTKKLLFLGTYPPPYGGISSHLYDLLPSLQKTGHKVISFTPYAEKNMNDEFENGLRIIKMTTRKMFVNNSLKILLFLFLNIKYLYSLKLIQYIRLVSCAFQLRKIIKNERIDIVYTFEEHILIIPFLKKIINNNIIIGIFGS